VELEHLRKVLPVVHLLEMEAVVQEDTLEAVEVVQVQLELMPHLDKVEMEAQEYQFQLLVLLLLMPEVEAEQVVENRLLLLH
jgi:hypothetical protein